MPGITNPAEEYFKDGTWAWDPVGKVWKKLIIDPVTDRLVIDHPGDLEVVQPIPADLCIANHGWDGSAWQKIPLVFGYSDRWAENVSDTASGVGDAVAQTAVVSPGYIYVLQQAEVYHTAAAAKAMGVTPIVGGTTCSIVHNLAADPWIHYLWAGALVLKAGDRVDATVTTPGDGKIVYLHVWGYKMKVAE